MSRLFPVDFDPSAGIGRLNNSFDDPCVFHSFGTRCDWIGIFANIDREGIHLPDLLESRRYQFNLSF